MLTRPFLLALLALIIGGCGSNPKADVNPNVARYPYTPEQIQDAHHVGLTKRYRSTSEGGQSSYSKIAVRSATKNGVIFARQTTDALGQATGEMTEVSATWLELRNHATYPRESTVISEERKAVRAGSYDCYKYVVTQGDLQMVIYFAKDLPGAPIHMATSVGGVARHELELIAVQ